MSSFDYNPFSGKIFLSRQKGSFWGSIGYSSNLGDILIANEEAVWVKIRHGCLISSSTNVFEEFSPIKHSLNTLSAFPITVPF